MPSRTYLVNYDITANTNGAISEFAKLEHPMKQVAEQARIARESLTQIVETAQRLKALCNNSFTIKPIIDTKSFADSLATMEANVKASSMRMRASLESALSGSLADNKRINDLLGANNWKKAESEQEDAIRKLESRLKLLDNIKSKFGTGATKSAEKARKEADEYFTGLKKSGIDGLQRAANLFNSEGIGNILYKGDNGWKLAKGDALTKIKDYTSKVKTELEAANKTLETAKAKNAKEFGDLAKQTSFNNRGNFIERALGVSPEALKEMNPMLDTIRTMMGNVQQTKDVIKKVSTPRPFKPSNLPSSSEINPLKQEISQLFHSRVKYPGESELRGLEKIVGTNHATSRDKKRLENLKAQKDIWRTSLRDAIGDKMKQVRLMQSQRHAYAKELNEWRKNPYTEVVEKIPVESSKVSKPITINIEGNFKSQIKPLSELATVLNAVPKTGIDIPVNIKVPTGIVSALESIKTGLTDIQKLKTTALKGGFDQIKKTAAETKKVAESAKKKATEKITTKATIDTSAINGQFTAAIDSLKKTASENSVIVKVGVDSSSAVSSFRASMDELKKVAGKNKAITIKTDIKTTGNYKKLSESIKSLKNRAGKANVSLKVKYDGVGLNGKLRETIKSMNEVTKKSFVTIKSKFDTSTVKKDLESTLKGLSKTTLKNAPTIKVSLDITSAQAQLTKLLDAIKAASPQTIKLGATNSGVKNTASNTPQSARTPRQAASSNRIYSNASGFVGGAAGGRTVKSSNKPGIVDRLRKSMYPLTGNVSLGASTPVALDMAKGMGIMYGVGGAMNLITGGLTDAMEYQNTMETAEEILRKNYSGKKFNQDFNSMAAEVRRVAKQTKFTAPQSAEATRFMAMAGLNIPQIKSAVSPIADVAVIGDNDFGEVADKFTNIQTAFQILPKDMRHMADAVTNTFTKTNTDMMMLAESMQYAAPMAHIAGESIENTLAMIGVMGNSGIQASMAGTTLRMMMQNTLNPNKKQAALWKMLGVKTRDSDGSLRDMIDILADVKVAAKNKKLPMADVVSNLFRVTASAGAGALINNIDKVKELAAQNKTVGNISSEISERKQNTVKGLWAQMTSAFTEANLRVFEQFQGDIKDMIKSVRDYFSTKEAIDNLRSAFELIKDLINAFGWIAKKWLGIYRQIGGLMKAIVLFQFVVAQIGFITKPIMSLINVFGGLKNMAIGFVSAFSGFGAVKKATVAASVAGAMMNGVANANNSVSNNAAVDTMSYLPYKDKMDRLQEKKYFYEVKENRLKNSVQKIGSQTGARMAINPLWFAPMSSFGGFAGSKNFNRDYFTAKNFLWERTWLPNKYDMKLQQLYYNKAKNNVGKVTDEITQLKNQRFESLRATRRPKQMDNIMLMERFAQKSRADKTEQRFADLALLSSQMRVSNQADAIRKRANSIYGFGRFGRSFSAAREALSFKSASKDLFSSLKSGFFSVISGLGKVLGAITSPIGLTIAGITALGAAAWALDRQLRKQAEESRRITNKMIANTMQSSNYGVVDYGKNGKQTKYFSIQSEENLPSVKKRNKQYNVAWDNRLFKDGANAIKEAKAWDEAYISPNREIFGKDYSLFSRDAMLSNTIKQQNELKNNPATYGTDTHFLSQLAQNKDLKNIQRLAQLSALYIEGANSKKASQLRDKIISLRQSLSNGKITDNEYQKLTSELMSKGGLTLDAIEKIPRFTGDPSTLKSKADWSKYQQYHYGMYNQLMAEIRGDQNTLSGYYKGVADLKSGVIAYSSEWWDAIRHIIGGMRTTVDSAGHAVQIKFDPTTGQIQWRNVINQIRKFNKNFKDTMYEYLKLMGQAYGAMVDDGLAGNYFKDWRKFYIEQNKHRVVSENDARYYYSHFDGYSGDALESVVKNGQWRDDTNEGAKRRKIIRERLAIMRADEGKRSHDREMKAIKDRQKAFQDSLTSGNGSGGSYSSPIADATKDTNNGLNYHNRVGSVNARPTQININVDKLANFDKVQFLEGKDRDMVMMITNAVAEAFGNASVMASALASNDKRDVYSV